MFIPEWPNLAFIYLELRLKYWGFRFYLYIGMERLEIMQRLLR
jgi:hypothetical protein